MLRVRDLHFSYGDLPVLRGVSLDAASGEICGLFGPNGCGKTTLFRCCLGLLPGRARSIAIDGRDLAGLDVGDRARLVAYVPQEHASPFPLLVRDVVMLGRTPHLGLLGAAGDEDRRIVFETIDWIGLTDLSERPFSHLSGGQRQLVLIARAVAQRTPLILLDEPASGLDFRNQVRIWTVLRALASTGTTVVVCTHDPNHVSWFCDRAIVMRDGVVAAAGPPDAALDAATLDALYPGTCAVVALEGRTTVVPRVVLDRPEQGR